VQTTKIDVATAIEEINDLFCEVVIAPEYDANN
jgi:AICAR transformylase/IMP cyclohydrolase PurH